MGSYWEDFGYDRDEIYGPEHDYEPDLSFMHLCCTCANLEDEPGYGAHCSKYPTMRAYMFGRKKECKHYDDISNYPIPEDW